MEDKINELRETFVEEITEDVALPAAQHLLTMNKNAEKTTKRKIWDILLGNCKISIYYEESQVWFRTNSGFFFHESDQGWRIWL